MIAGSIALSYEQDNPSIRIMDDSAEAVELKIGLHVEVRDRYQGTWSRGFEISAIEDNGYRIKRISDGAILPGTFSTEEIRPSRRHQGLWWY
jgi:hypothetical protein